MPLSTAAIKPNHKAIQAYYQTLQSYADLNKTHETATRTAFLRLLEDTARVHGWNVITEDAIRLDNGRIIRPDATLYKNSMPRGYWEAKDTGDDLDSEIRKKRERGYPLTNIIFEDTRQAVLFQNEQEAYRVTDLADAAQLATLLNTYFAYTKPVFESYDRALDQFKTDVPRLSGSLIKTIATAHQTQKAFQDAFNSFFDLCKTALNPTISRAAIDEMLVQHLLTERLIRKIFDNPEFTNRNVIAVEIEKVIRALVSPSFSRDEYLRDLEVYYQAIEQAAHGLTFGQKQKVLNEVYERFFQGYSTRIADTHGIVYTPQPIVDFMCASVVEVLQTEFGKSLGDKDVVILDPCTGTGNFIVNLLRRASRRDLESLYRERLFANEIMLLPYYIAALNIEHAYYELTGQYESFEGLCFVDTLDIAERRQLSFLTEQNSARVDRQKQAPITVIIGNPPYNVGQANENDNNKNRTYDEVDRRIRETYAKDSKATLKTQLYDPYVKFFRWAADRLQGRDGIVCYVSNNSFVDQIAFDGMRKHLLQDFTRIYHVDLHGNVRKNPKLSGTTHNVFGIQVGVGITVAIRSVHHTERCLYYHRVPEDWRKEEKYNWLARAEETLTPNPSPSGRGESKARPVASGREESEAHFRERVSEVMIQVGRELRAKLTSAEALLWEHLRDRRLAGIKFRRQHPIAQTTYVADFYCYESRLVIELDGSVHDSPQQQQADMLRQQEIEALGNTVLRFRNEQILGDLKSVLATILEGHETLTLNPSPSGRGTSMREASASASGRGTSMREADTSPVASEASSATLLSLRRAFDSPRPEGEGLGVRVNWQALTPDNRYTWLVPDNADSFERFLPMGSKTTKAATDLNVEAIFKTYSGGVKTNRDDIVYDFDAVRLASRMAQFVENYNLEVDRFKRAKGSVNIDDFVSYERIKWDGTLKGHLRDHKYGDFDEGKIRNALYRPFTNQKLYFDRMFINSVYLQPYFFPTPEAEQENRIIWLKVGSDWSMFSLMANCIVDLLPQGGSQCFPFYVYDSPRPEGEGQGVRVSRRENITDWALAQFRAHYADESISKWDIFYYVYGLLHHPGYRATFADNLKRELPRIPFAPDFRAFVEAGQKLADLHLDYETVEPYKLRWIEAKDTPLSYHVEKMRLIKPSSPAPSPSGRRGEIPTQGAEVPLPEGEGFRVRVNDSLTLIDIPPEVYQYRLGNRSALEWVIDQYQVSIDKRSGITSDPNRADDPRYIVDLVGRVVAVSVATVKIVAGLPEQYSDK